jgi:hypothetical protein
MRNYLERVERHLRLAVLFGCLIHTARDRDFACVCVNRGFSVPDDVALRIRLDDTLTSTDSEVSDPFSATVVDRGNYEGARVYGHVAEIDMSGRVKGRPSMMLRFDRLVMPDGPRAASCGNCGALSRAFGREGGCGRSYRIRWPRADEHRAYSAWRRGWCFAGWDLRGWQRGWHRFCDRRRWWARNHCFPRASEDHTKQRSRNVDSHHLALIPNLTQDSRNEGQVDNPPVTVRGKHGMNGRQTC